MPKGDYDHHKKAGNEGDVVKHVALIAALDSAVDQHRGGAFHYADIYAGYAHHCLGRGGEWTRGIGKLCGRCELRENQHTALYREWYLSRPLFEGGFYPGSSLIAADVCKWKKEGFRLSLWDISPKAVSDLKRVFKGKQHRIYDRAATASDPGFQSANFVLIDPPKGNSKTWDFASGFLNARKQNVLLWWPIFANTRTIPPSENSQSKVTREAACRLGFSVSKVLWAKGGRMIGCQLIYRLDSISIKKLRAAIEQVVRVIGGKWRVEHFDS
jgi:23S rRNA A2030 N6-methylase RlmJ